MLSNDHTLRKATVEECVAFNHLRWRSPNFQALLVLRRIDDGLDLTLPAVAWAQEMKDAGYAFGPRGLYVIERHNDTVSSTKTDVQTVL